MRSIRPVRRLGQMLFCVGVLFWCSAVPLLADDWLIFRGNPGQTGIAPGGLPEKLEVLWQFKAKDGIESAAAIAKGVVYLGSYDQNLYALDLVSGKEKWHYKGGPFKAPPGVHDDSVYIGDMDGLFHCIDAATGTKKWTYDTNAEISSGPNFNGKDVLFGASDENLYCLRDGKERWKFRVEGGPVYGSPAIVGKRTFAAGCDSNLHVIDIDTGKEVSTALPLNGQVGATVAVIEDRLYIGTMSSQVFAIEWQKPAIAWTFEPAERAQPFRSSAAVTSSLVVIGSQDKSVYALDRKTGKQMWKFPTRGRVESSPVVAGNRAYFGSSDGNLYVVDLASGAEVQKYRLGGDVKASPVVADGKLIIGNEDGLVVCLGAK